MQCFVKWVFHRMENVWTCDFNAHECLVRSSHFPSCFGRLTLFDLNIYHVIKSNVISTTKVQLQYMIFIFILIIFPLFQKIISRKSWKFTLYKRYTQGNLTNLLLVVDSMNFIPCRPSFCSLPLLLLLSPATQERLTSAQQPHILLIVADDLGYNDVSWHNTAMVMPNLDTLARYLQYLQYLLYLDIYTITRTGVILEQSYVQPTCTPTRSALMTGRYPVHTGGWTLKYVFS